MSENEQNISQNPKYLLSNKIMLIIGARNQLALDLAHSGAELGAQIVLAGLEEEILKEAAKKLVANQYKALFTSMNPTKPEEVSGMLNSIVEKFNSLDFLIINVDFRIFNAVVDVTWVELQNHLLMNFTAPFLCIQKALRRMQKGGAILVMNSTNYNACGPNNSVYSASKTALHQLITVAREEAKHLGVKIVEVFVNEVSSKKTDKTLLKKFNRDAARQILVATNPKSVAYQKEIYIELL